MSNVGPYHIELGSYQSIDSFGRLKAPSGYDMVALNSGRACLLHCLIWYGLEKVLLPYYYCEEVVSYLEKHGIEVERYHIGSDLLPCGLEYDKEVSDETLLVVVNYFGLVERRRIANVVKRWKHVVVDNCTAYFERPIRNAMNVYSPRKFIGVADGGLIYGKAGSLVPPGYELDRSSERSSFLLQRIEFGCSYAYPARLESERAIAESEPKLMSKLTVHLLAGAPLKEIKWRRVLNYRAAESVFGDVNRSPGLLPDGNVPYAFPLFLDRECDGLRSFLISKGVFVSHLWPVDDNANDSEGRLSRNMVLLPIDQRITISDIVYMRKLVGEYFGV